MRMRFLAMLVMAASSARACACGGEWPSVKDDLRDAPVAILGTVVFANPESGEMFKPQVVKIRADEAFKGASVGQVFEMHMGGSDCDAKFKLGARSVLFLYPGSDGTWGVVPCRGSDGPDALAFLRALPKSAQGTRLSGEVELYENTAKNPFRKVGGVPGVQVKITDDHGAVRDVVTNQDGVYELYGVPAGTYSASLNPPAGLRIKFPVTAGSPYVEGKENAVILGPDAAASISFVLQADTRLSGRVRGHSEGSHLCFQLEPVDDPGARVGFDCSRDDGTFASEMMAPGKYRLVARQDMKIDGHQSSSTLYYPGVRTRADAAVVMIEAGKYVGGLEWSIPVDETRVVLSGRVEYADGVPASGSVRFSSESAGYYEESAIGPDGSFTLLVLPGIDGELIGLTSEISTIARSCAQFRVTREQGMIVTAETGKVQLKSDTNRPNLKLVLPFAHCESQKR